MSFVEKLNNVLNEEFNYSVTENGAIGYRTTGKQLLDLNFSVSSLRNADRATIIGEWNKAYYQDPSLALRWLFYLRDARQGLGERRTFRIILNDIAKNEPEIAKKLFCLIPEYGRFDDLWVLLDNKEMLPNIISFVKHQLRTDWRNMKNNESVSLLAKWMPSENSSSKQTKHYAHLLCSGLGASPKQYRKVLSELRKYIDIVERKMSAKQWSEINYEAVPSRANLIYNDAFLRNDEERRRAYLSKLEKGTAKINADVLFPHDIVHKYNNENCTNATLEALWKALPNTVNGCNNTIVVADGSGSMETQIGNTSITALEVANALAIYFAERCSGEFKNKYITFSTNPQLVNFGKAKTLRQKISIALQHCEVSNTNIECVFDLILYTAVQNRMSQDELPKNILILSDMEFDDCVTANGSKDWWDCKRPDQRLFDTIEQRYKNEGYKLPRLIFWNLCSRTATIPVRENDLGVALVSGFSPNIVKMVMSGKTDPFECLVDVLMDKRYDAITAALR